MKTVTPLENLSVLDFFKKSFTHFLAGSKTTSDRQTRKEGLKLVLGGKQSLPQRRHPKYKMDMAVSRRGPSSRL